jgi:hypothetical protein
MTSVSPLLTALQQTTENAAAAAATAAEDNQDNDSTTLYTSFTPTDLYRVGCALHYMGTNVEKEGITTEQQQLINAYQELLNAWTVSQRRTYFHALHQGLVHVLNTTTGTTSTASSSSSSSAMTTSTIAQCITALNAMKSLYQHAPISTMMSALTSPDCTRQTLITLAQCYTATTSEAATSLAFEQLSTSILSLLSHLIWKDQAVVVADEDAEDDDDVSYSHCIAILPFDKLVSVLETLVEDHKLVWKALLQYRDNPTTDGISSNWRQVWLHNHHTHYDETQQHYLQSWIQQNAYSNTTDDDVKALSAAVAKVTVQGEKLPYQSSTSTTQARRRQEEKEDMVQRQIDAVRNIVPQYGEGFVELALAYTKGNVSEAVAILTGPATEWPSAWQTLDPHLPRRHQRKVQDRDEVATAVTKAALQAADEQEEYETNVFSQFTTPIAAAHDVYNDDYDDQWDALEGYDQHATVDDGGLYDDYDAVRTYNRLVRDDEREAAFWQEQRNLNQRQTRNKAKQSENGSNNDDDDDKDDNTNHKYRGPDKLRGGRLPKPPPPTTAGTAGKKGKSKGKSGGGSAGSSTPSQAGGSTAQAPKKDSNGKSNSDSGQPPSRAAQRHKDRKLANRRAKQRQSMNKRTGAE